MSTHRSLAPSGDVCACPLPHRVASRSFLAMLFAVASMVLYYHTAQAQPIVEPPTQDEISIVVPESPFPTADESTVVEAPPAVQSTSENTALVSSEGFDPAQWERTYRVNVPGIRHEPPPTTLSMGNRASVLAYYHAFFDVPIPPMGWTGDYATCNAGTTSAAYLEATRKRIAYYRAMAGVSSDIVMYPPFVQQAQAAALMMSANKQLSHTPSASWRCYSEAGATAAGAANIASAPGPVAIDLYLHDGGSGNTAVGHRRWLLYPQLTRVGAGSTASEGDIWGSNVLYVLDGETIWGARPPVRDGYVAWPPRGYVPYPIVPTRWSFSYPGADFGSATVTMRRNGSALSVVKEPLAAGYGENTLAWRPQIGSDPWPKPVSDTTFEVEINNVRIGGANRTFAYTVIVFDPG